VRFPLEVPAPQLNDDRIGEDLVRDRVPAVEDCPREIVSRGRRRFLEKSRRNLAGHASRLGQGRAGACQGSANCGMVNLERFSAYDVGKGRSVTVNSARNIRHDLVASVAERTGEPTQMI
jgi:ferredoxin